MGVNFRTKKGYGAFGNLRKNYDRSRKGFPEEAVDFILRKIGRENPCVLDIGCGTGIATRQLREKGAEVTGTDIDADMIRQAKVDNRYRVEYQVAPAEKQPFENNVFDAVTAFSAFHWFATKAALDEIKRVLKPNGFFFAVNKNEAGNFKSGYKNVLRQFVGQELPDAKKKYNPKEVLQKNGFWQVEEKSFLISEYFTLEEALFYLQSVSVWNLVTTDKKTSVLKVLREHFLKTSDQNGRVERKLNVVVVSGKTQKHG